MNRKLVKYGDDIFRIIEQNETDMLVINFNKQTMPKWFSASVLEEEGGADIFLDSFKLLIQDYVCTLSDSYTPTIV